MRDPRQDACFQPRLWPVLAGPSDSLPPPTPIGAKAQDEFLAAYYEINCQASRWHSQLAEGNSSLAALAAAALDQAILAKENLEDQYAPLGISVSPELKDGLVVTLHFSFPRTGPFPPRRKPSSASLCVALPRPNSAARPPSDAAPAA